MHKLSCLFGIYRILFSSEETEPLATLLLDFLIFWCLLLPHFQSSLLLFPTSFFWLLDYDSQPSARHTVNTLKYLWSEYPSHKYRCFSLALVSFFTNMNLSIHTLIQSLCRCLPTSDPHSQPSHWLIHVTVLGHLKTIKPQKCIYSPNRPRHPLPSTTVL